MVEDVQSLNVFKLNVIFLGSNDWGNGKIKNVPMPSYWPWMTTCNPVVVTSAAGGTFTKFRL